MDSLKAQERRQFKRVRLSEAVRYQLIDPAQFGGCLSYDISQGGLKIYFNDFVPMGVNMTLQIRLGLEKVLEKTARIVWVKQLPFSDKYHIGLKFISKRGDRHGNIGIF